MTDKGRRLAIVLAVVTAVAALSLPADAQLSNGRSAFPDLPRAEPVQLRDFFQSFGGFNSPSNPVQRPQQVYESVRAPLPKKMEAPPTSSVVVIGDTTADWLGYGLEAAFADSPEVGIVRKIKYFSGLVRYEAAHGEVQDWSQAINELLGQEKPSAIVVMLGTNDRLPLREPLPPPKNPPNSSKEKPAAAQPPTPPPARPAEQTDSEQQSAGGAPEPPRRPGAYYEFHSDDWARLYNKRIDEMIAALKAKGVPVLWVGLPAIRGARSTTDMSYLDELYRARAEKAGITYVDIWDGFVDDKGQFAVQGPDFEGQTRRLRTYDGVNFTKPGAEKLAHYVEHELRRVMTSPVVPVALPSPEDQSKGNARPEIGPVVPLSVTATGERGDLLGAPTHPTQPNSDPVATRVLTHGEAIGAPPGRADDFSWPRTDANAVTEPPPAAVSAPPTSAQQSAKGAARNQANKIDASKDDAGKADAAKNDVKKPLAPGAAPARPGQPRAALDGGPQRAPAPLAPARD
jgi:uncharacterized protein